MGGYVYIRASQRNGTIYTGVTNSISRRDYEHRTGEGSKFCRKYGVENLVYYEWHDDIRDAIYREKCIKKWNRAWKLRLIEERNPQWKDLLEEMIWED